MTEPSSLKHSRVVELLAQIGLQADMEIDGRCDVEIPANGHIITWVGDGEKCEGVQILKRSIRDERLFVYASFSSIFWAMASICQKFQWTANLSLGPDGEFWEVSARLQMDMNADFEWRVLVSNHTLITSQSANDAVLIGLLAGKMLGEADADGIIRDRILDLDLQNG